MRNAMVCASVMLAMYLCWPLVFGGGATQFETAAHASGTLSAAELQQHRLDLERAVASGSAPLSCTKRFAMAQAQCGAGGSCNQTVADKFDLCEASGFWPE